MVRLKVTGAKTSMLRGRESLIRLIGKRRRFLPHRQSILSTAIQNTLDLKDGLNDNVAAVTESESLGSMDAQNGNGASVLEACASDSVKCPVCGNVVRGGDGAINVHLDACLTRGTKRKLTQPTLLQLNFLSKSANVVVKEPDDSDCSADSVFRYTNHKLQDVGPPIECSHNQCRSPERLETQYLDADGSMDNSTNDDRKNCNVITSLSPLKDEKLNFERAVIVDDIFEEKFQTFIVGRRFGDGLEITPSTCISLLRDPSNANDANAIKVISKVSGSEKLLGYIPRELAQCLSSLMEKFCLKVEGHVISAPKHSHDAIPIQILCQSSMSCSHKKHDDAWAFKSLWNNLRCAVESARTNLSDKTKYQKNFNFVIQEVLKSCHHLFTEDETLLLESFISLSDDCQKLFVRLYTRKGPWFRMSSIFYPEISNCEEAAKKLCAAGYMCFFECSTELHNNDMQEVLNLLTKPELIEVTSMMKKELNNSNSSSTSGQWSQITMNDTEFCDLKCNKGIKKQDLISSILAFYTDGLCPSLPSIIKRKTGECLQLSISAESLIWRAERLFFLNGEQDLSAFLLVDLGIIKYPAYNCIGADHIFSSHNDLLAYEEALEVAQIMDESLNEDNTELVERCIEIAGNQMSCSMDTTREVTTESVTTTFLSCFTASWIYSKVVFLGVSFLEREHRYNDAIILLKQLLSTCSSDGRRGYWTLRLSINMEHLGRHNESLLVAENGLVDPCVRAGSKIALQRRVLRLGKPPRRWKVPSFSESIQRKIIEIQVRGRPLNSETGTKSRFYGEDGEQCGVEELALQYYAGEGGGWQGIHTESGIWLTIFGLLMWDIIFADVPNVFRNKFQTSPLDLESDNFYHARKEKIELHLQKIQGGMAEEILIMTWQSQSGTSCRGVNWTRHSLSVLRAAVTCVGGPCLASICRQLAQDYRGWSKGMPDLLLWRFQDDYKGEAKLVEVKGPRDRLSEQQRAWLLFLMDCGFNAEVCKVSPLS